MKKKYRIKNRPNNNEFSELTGIEAIEMVGGTNCLITDRLRIYPSAISIQKHAYRLYVGFDKLSRNIYVSASCGAENCVRKNHLLATYKPSGSELEYINSYKKIDSPEYMSHRLDVPMELLKPFLK